MGIEIIGKLNDGTLFTFKNLLGLIFRKAEIYRARKIEASCILSSSTNSC